MPFRLFQYPLPAAHDLADLNAYIARERVVAVTREIVATPSGALLVFVVETLAGNLPAGKSREARVDYRDELNDADFAVFRRLRELRKQLADAEGMPVYALFSNAQLAEMARRRCASTADLAAIDGVGEQRIARYGAQFLAALAAGDGGAGITLEAPEAAP